LKNQFLLYLQLTYEYHPPNLERFKAGVGAALKSILEKRVLQTLDVVLDNPKLEPELRKSIKENLLVLLDGGNGGHSENMNNVLENHIRAQEQSNQPMYNNNVKTSNQNFNNSHTPTTPTPSVIAISTSICNSLIDCVNPVTKPSPSPSPPPPIIDLDPEFGDDDEVLENKPDPPRVKEKDVVEEADRERVFEKIQRLPTNIRLPFESLLSQSEMKVNNR